MGYSTIQTFLMKHDTVTSIYKSLTTSANRTIRLTGNHPIYARKNANKFSLV